MHRMTREYLRPVFGGSRQARAYSRRSHFSGPALVLCIEPAREHPEKKPPCQRLGKERPRSNAAEQSPFIMPHVIASRALRGVAISYCSNPRS